MNGPTRNALMSLVVVIAVTACGGGGGGGSGSPPPPPPPPPPVSLTLTSSVPANAATNVAREVLPTLDFSAPIDAATAIPANFALSSAGGSQPVAVSVSGARITVEPSGPLQPELPYTLTVSTAVRGTGGQQLAGAVSVTFSTRGGAWGTATLIEPDDDDSAHNPQIALDDSGNALAVWDQTDGTRANIWSNRFTPASGWGTAELRENSTRDAYSPHVAFDGQGNALAVWQQSDGTRYNIWSSRFTPAGGWQAPVLIENDPNDARDVQLAVSSNGDAFAVWSQTSTIRPTTIWASSYTAGSGWAAPTRIQSITSGDGFLAQVAVNASGNAVAVWHQTDGARYNVWASRYSGGWEAAALIENDNAGSAQYAQAGIDSAGNAIAVWQQHDGTRFNIMANRLPSGGDWGAATALEEDDRAATLPQITMNAAGDAVVVWMREQEGGEGQDVVANGYVRGTGWGAAAEIETDDRSAILPAVALSGSGVAYAIWMQYDGTRFNINASRYTPSGGWGMPSLIDTASGDAFNPHLAINSSGTVQAIWRQTDGTRYNVWASRFE